MKVSLAILCASCLACGTASAQVFDVGGYALYSTGGDTQEDSIGYGGQLAVEVRPYVSFMASVDRFSDAGVAGFGNLDATALGLSLRLDSPAYGLLSLYGGGGVSYNLYEGQLSYLEFRTIETESASVEEFVARTGSTLEEARRVVTSLGASADMKLDPSLAYHAFAGLTLDIGERIKLFLEYRYATTEVEGEISRTDLETITYPVVPSDYAYSLIHAGAMLAF